MWSVRRLRRQSEGRSGTARSSKTTDGDTAATIRPVRQHGGRHGFDKKRRVVTKGEYMRTRLRSTAFIRTGTAPQDTQDKRDGLVSQTAVTSTRQDEDVDGCGERRHLPQSDRSGGGGTKVRHPQGQLAAGAPRRQTDGERSRGPDGTSLQDLNVTIA
ncbi:hypothetical protein A4X09_0g1876 [Tilletia walkeri]|uniref:Uncharacterized protein n=1 Tax=Tilletia walkeri TaxID=117179 RepID=A0A8X7T6C4_9BASI|nr:hypothetical protein A4X09_0g1876 [Tilletia walkeri]